MEDLSPEHVLDMQADSRLHIIFGGTKVVQHIPPQKASTGLKRTYPPAAPRRGRGTLRPLGRSFRRASARWRRWVGAAGPVSDGFLWLLR